MENPKTLPLEQALLPQAPSTGGSDMSSSTQSIIAASALVGESILDSPRDSIKKKKKNTSSNSNNNNNNDRGVVRHDFSRARIQKLLEAESSSSSTDNDGRWVSKGLSWMQRQRERAQRLELERQVEEQRQIIYEAQQQQQQQLTQQQQSSSSSSTLQARRRNNTSPPIQNALQGNATFLSLTNKKTTTNKTTAPNDWDHQAEMLRVSSPRTSHSGSGITVNLQLQQTTNNIPVDNQNDDYDSDDDDADWIPQVRIEPEPPSPHPFCPYILSESQMQSLAKKALPAGIAYARWTRLYSLARDGDAFDAFLRRVHGVSHTLLVIRTTRGSILGGYADSPWESKTQTSVFYGSAQACLFGFQDNTTTHDNNNNEDDHLHVYKWTGVNRYIQLCDATHKMLAFGGGGVDGAFGLCIEEDFQRGSTGPCDTFGNEPLCDQENFEVVDVEVYGFLTGQF